MQTLTIKAVSLASARSFRDSLEGFQTELVESEHGTYLVNVNFSGGDREIVSVLDALQEHVTRRADGPATIGLAGRNYELHPDPPG